MAKRLLHKYTFSAGTDTVVIDGNWSRDKLLLITNVVDNIIIYNFADPNLRATSHTYNSSTDQTTVVLNYNCAAMTDTDDLQIFVEEDAVHFKPSQTYTDPVSKFRVSQGQTLIDTDFEYGLQSTKWETLELVNNIPGFYSKTGDTPLTVTAIQGTSGSKTITITAPSHSQSSGTPIDIRGLTQSTLEGGYLITRVSDADTIILTGKTEVVTTGSLLTPYTTIIPGRFYANSDINYTNIVGIGTTITVTTQYPNGFQDGSEFYLSNTLGVQTIEFDSSLADVNDTEFKSSTFDPNGTATINSSNTLITDPWDYISTLNSKFIRAGSGGQITPANTITSASHGFTNGQCVAVVNGPNSTLPTGLTDQGRYFIVNADTNTFQLSLTSGGAVVSITANTGAGVFAVFRGYGVTAVNSTTETVTISESNSAVTTTTTLLLINSSAGDTVVTTPANQFQRTTSTHIWDGTTPIDYFFTSTSTTTSAIKDTSTGANINFNASAITGSPILIPVQLNPNRNTITVSNHNLNANDPVTGVALTYRYRISTGSTAIPGLTNQTAYFLEKIDNNTFALLATAGGARVNLTGYGEGGPRANGPFAGYAHSIFATENRLTANTLVIPSHGLLAGQQLVYGVPNGASAIGGLTADQTYYVGTAKSDSSNRIVLTVVSGGSTVNLTSAGVGTNTLDILGSGALDGSYPLLTVVDNTNFTLGNISSISSTRRTFDPSVVGIASTTDATIQIPNHRFITGTDIVYTKTYADSTVLGGLTDNTKYYAIRQTKDKIRLATSQSNALAGIYVSFTSVGSGKTHSVTTNSIVGETSGIGSVHITNGSTKVEGTDTLFLSQFKAGDILTVDLPDAQSGLGTIFSQEIASIGDNTQLTLVSAATTAGIGLTYLRKTALYVRSEAYGLHRPYDGGVQINAKNVADAQIIRQTRRYFRYQSGKGLNVQFAINFNPPVDAQSINASGTTATVTTRSRHQVSVGSSITVRNAEVSSGTNEYNGNYVVSSVPSETTFTYTMSNTPAQTFAGGFPEFTVTGWGGARMKAGPFDDQNGFYWEFDGTTLYAVRRNSIQQLSGTVAVTRKSNIITGTDTRFSDQLSVDDKIVIRGQSYKVVNIESNSILYIQPAYRGTTATYCIASKTIDDKIAQQDFNIDPCDGTGPNGYVLDKTRIQMAYIDYSWYGAGKGRFGFKDADGEVFYCHEFVHNNKRNEAYFRSGNLPARYEIENVGKPSFAPSLAHWGTTVQMDGGFDDDDAYLFTASSSLLSFSGASVGVAVTAGTVVGSGVSTYTYVNNDGTVATAGISTYNILTFNGSSGASVSTAQDFISFTSTHGYATGQLVQYNAGSGGTVIVGLTQNEYYYVRVRSSQSIFLYTSEATAIAGGATGLVNMTSLGSGTAHQIRSSFRFSVTSTPISGYGNRILHRIQTTQGTWSSLSTISFGTPITSTAIAARGGVSTPDAYVYRVLQSTSPNNTSTIIDFFFADEPKSLTYPNFPSLGETGFIQSNTNAVDTFTLGDDSTVPSLIPLISVRLAPSVDSGTVGALGVKEILNRMQLDLKGVGLLTTHDVDIQLILNGQIDNFNWTNQGIPSLTQLISHTNGDTISGGTKVFSFRASGGAEVTSGGKRNANTFSQDISSLLSLGNAILGGNGIYPDGPDVLTVAVVPLNPSQITISAPLSVSGRVTWSESQA